MRKNKIDRGQELELEMERLKARLKTVEQELAACHAEQEFGAEQEFAASAAAAARQGQDGISEWQKAQQAMQVEIEQMRLIIENKSNQALLRANAELEARVQERTAELQLEIEQRKQTEAAMLWHTTLLQLMSNASLLGYLVVDNRTDRILYSNRRFCEIWGIAHLQAAIQRGELLNNDIIPACLPALVDVPAFAESCKPLQDESNRIVVEDEIPFTGGRTVRRFSTQIRSASDEYFGRFYIFEEITARKQIEISLRKSEARYRELFETSKDGIVITDMEGRFINANQAYLDLLGYASVEELRQRSYIEITLPEYQPIEARIVQEQILSRGYSDEYEKVYLRKTGARAPVSLRTWLIRGADGRPEGMWALVRDITERKQAEAELQASHRRLLESEALYRTLFETSQDGISIADLEGRIIDMNRAFLDLLGYASVEELRDRSYLEFTPHEYQPIEARIVQEQILPRGYSDEYEKEYLRKDGARVPVSLRVWINKSAGGQSLGTWALARDISERKRAETELRESEEKYHVLFNNEIFAICIFDQETRQILDANKAAICLYGYSQEELLGGMTALDLAADRKVALNVIDQAARHETTFVPLRYHRKKDGTVFPVEVVGGPYIWKGRPVMFDMARDISLRLQAQQALQASQERYHDLFEHSPIPLMEQDLSAMKRYLDDLRAAGETDLRSYFERRPEAVIHCAELIKMLDVNQASLAFWGAENKADLLAEGMGKALVFESFDAFCDELIALAEGDLQFDCSYYTYRTLRGEERYGNLHLSVAPDYKDSLQRVLISLVDITERRQAEQALQISQLRLTTAIQVAHLAYWDYNVDADQFTCDNHFYALFGRAAAQEAGYQMQLEVYLRQYVHPDDKALIAREIAAALNTADADYESQVEYRILHADGQELYLSNHIYIIKNALGRTTNLYGALQDITGRKLLEIAMEQTEKRYHELADSQGEGVYVTDVNGVFLFANPAAEALFGVAPGGLTGRDVPHFAAPDQAKVVDEQLALRALKQGSTYEMRIIRLDGEERRLLITATPRLDSQQNHIGTICVCRDITQRNLDEKKMRYASAHDALTGLYNQGAFEEALQRAEYNDKYPIAVIMIDVDNLKLINDSLGHPVGDQLLRTVAVVLGRSVRESDVAARLGGDEFAILLPTAGAEAMQRVIARIGSYLSDENTSGKKPFTVSISIGGAVSANPGMMVDVVQRADLEMYQHKRNKKNTKADNASGINSHS